MSLFTIGLLALWVIMGFYLMILPKETMAKIANFLYYLAVNYVPPTIYGMILGYGFLTGNALLVICAILLIGVCFVNNEEDSSQDDYIAHLNRVIDEQEEMIIALRNPESALDEVIDAGGNLDVIVGTSQKKARKNLGKKCRKD